jgi:hypothetical protein
VALLGAPVCVFALLFFIARLARLLDCFQNLVFGNLKRRSVAELHLFDLYGGLQRDLVGQPTQGLQKWSSGFRKQVQGFQKQA